MRARKAALSDQVNWRPSTSMASPASSTKQPWRQTSNQASGSQKNIPSKPAPISNNPRVTHRLQSQASSQNTSQQIKAEDKFWATSTEPSQYIQPQLEDREAGSAVNHYYPDEDDYEEYDPLDYYTSRVIKSKDGRRREPMLRGQRNARRLEKKQNGTLTRGWVDCNLALPL